MSEADYFEQFAGDDPMEYGRVTHRLVWNPTGQFIEYEPGNGGYDALHNLWKALGEPRMMLSELGIDVVAQTYANGRLVNEVHGW